MTKTVLRLMRLKQTLELRSLSRAQHYRMVSEGLFPPGVLVGKRAVAWPQHEVEAMLGAQIAGGSDQELRDLVATLLKARSNNKLLNEPMQSEIGDLSSHREVSHEAR
jgi:prophage regulatory protein